MLSIWNLIWFWFRWKLNSFPTCHNMTLQLMKRRLLAALVLPIPKLPSPSKSYVVSQLDQYFTDLPLVGEDDLVPWGSLHDHYHHQHHQTIAEKHQHQHGRSSPEDHQGDPETDARTSAWYLRHPWWWQRQVSSAFWLQKLESLAKWPGSISESSILSLDAQCQVPCKSGLTNTCWQTSIPGISTSLWPDLKSLPSLEECSNWSCSCRRTIQWRHLR